MSDFKEVIGKLNNFVKQHELKKYNTPKNLSMAIMVECSELMEHFQWKNDKEIRNYIFNKKDVVGGELADIANYIFEFSDIINIDLKATMLKKIRINSKKYKEKGKI